ncbi:hypothetical protein HMPREF0185_01053 [Brevundimonas diminuta 470-4]|nr:hypothetical protein HMPREF0185_01053 [Brevundimonas diminuta 470-4]
MPAAAAFAVLDGRLEGGAIRARLSPGSFRLAATCEQAEQDQGGFH